MSGCAGQCCAAFTLTHTPEQLLGGDVHTPRASDAAQIGAMVRALSLVEIAERLVRYEISPEWTASWAGDPEGPSALYACINWDESTRLCRAYSQRPEMCSLYPYGRPCQHDCDCRGATQAPLSQASWEGDGA